MEREDIHANDFEKFLRYLEKKVGPVNRSDSASMDSVREIMATQLAVYGGLFVE